MGIDVSKFKQGINEAKASLKTLDAALKLNETQLKATGDKEVYLANKTATLKAQIEAQGNIVRTTTAALQAMDKAGVNPLSTDYQKLQAQLYQANEAMIESTSSLSQLEAGAEEASESTDKLSDSVGSIGKKLSLDAVIGGIDKITGTMKKAAEMAVNLGKAIWENISDSASWADNVATQATILGMSVEDYQKLQSVFDTVADVTVADWTAARRKIRQAINDPSQDQIDVLAALGIKTHDTINTGFGMAEGMAKDWETVFWEAAKELQRRVESGRMTADLADTWGEALFGKKYSNLLPLIGLGQEAFNQALKDETVVSEDAIKKLAELNDAYINLQDDFRKLKAEVMSSLAPALEGAANVLDTLLNNLMEYLKTEEGQKALENMEKAVSGLFDDLGKISPEQVVEGFSKVFGDIVNGFTWISDHWGDVKAGIEGIGIAFLVMQGMSNVLTIIQMINGLRDLASGKISIPTASPTTPTTPTTGGGGSGGGWWTNLINGISGKVASIGTAGLQNLGLVYDWIMHGTPFGQMLTNGGSLQDAINAQLGSAKETGKNIWGNMGDWWETTKGVYGNAIDFWKQFYGNIPELFKADQDYLDFEAELAARIRQDLGLDEPPAENGESVFDEYMKQRLAKEASKLGSEDASGLLEGLIGIQNITVEPKPEDNAAEKIAQDVGVVQVPAELVFGDVPGQEGGGGSHGFANGLPRVPWDGFPAILHKDETIVPARQINNSRNFSSNLYVENMNMNGASAEGLAATMAAAQRRMMRGYGS